MAAPARQTRGRQRIPMRLIESQDDLYASFSKRRLGLFKKGGELCTLCGADIGIIVFSPTDNPFSFFSPSMESVFERYASPDQPPKHAARAVDAHARFRIEKLNKQLDQLLEQKLKLKAMDEGLAEIDRTREKGWWEEASVETLNKEQVEDWTMWFNNFKDRVEIQIQHLQNGGSTSSMNQLQNGRDGSSSSAAEAAATGLLNLSGGGDQQCYYPSPQIDMYGGGESSSQYVYRQPLSPYFSPEYRYYVSPGADDGGSGGGGGDESGQHGFLPPTMNQSTSMSFAPHYHHLHHHVYSGAGDLSNAGENNEDDAGTSNQGGNE